MALRGLSKAHAFELTASDGRKISSEGLLGRKHLVLYFYPADFTPVCTKETCGFRDAYQELSGQDTEVVGVSVDNKESHARFAEKYNVPFPLVSDEDQARRAGKAGERVRARARARLRGEFAATRYGGVLDTGGGCDKDAQPAC